MRHCYGPLLVVSLAFCACKGTEPFVATPTTINVSASSVIFTSLGVTRSIHATVLDQKGDSIPGAKVTWQSLASTVAEM